jgi:hypothetical protein
VHILFEENLSILELGIDVPSMNGDRDSPFSDLQNCRGQAYHVFLNDTSDNYFSLLSKAHRVIFPLGID